MSENTNENVIELTKAKIYQGETLVLSDVNLFIKKGEFAYLIGKTGSGKSSLLKTLYGDLSLRQGTGKVVDVVLNGLKSSKVPFLRRKLGIVFQDFQLLMDRTVGDNLLFVLKATGWKDKKAMLVRIEEVLDQVGLKTKDFKMPHELSGGEQQRVVIARALLNDPELILADEPTGNLDPDTSEDIMNLLFKISAENNTAVLMATHNYYLIEKYPARIIKCTNGRLVIDQDISAQG
ncbi:MAG: ATP-binding cassette domain-containing protein [Chitinophagaceae bacterium]|nr:MAG: ATP-binding cassette domain-containing protein [Chitinophagaceae bacterium]